MELPNWFKRRATLKNVVVYGVPLFFTAVNFCATFCTTFYSTMNSKALIFVSMITTVSVSPLMLMLDFERMGTSIKKFMAISTYAVCLSGYLGLASMRMYGLNIPYSVIIESFLGASTVMVPWLINNASYKFFTLSEDLLDDYKEHHNVTPELKKTLKLELGGKLSEDAILFSRFEKTLLPVSSQNNDQNDQEDPSLIALPISTSSSNDFTDPSDELLFKERENRAKHVLPAAKLKLS